MSDVNINPETRVEEKDIVLSAPVLEARQNTFAQADQVVANMYKSIIMQNGNSDFMYRLSEDGTKLEAYQKEAEPETQDGLPAPTAELEVVRTEATEEQ